MNHLQGKFDEVKYINSLSMNDEKKWSKLMKFVEKKSTQSYDKHKSTWE